MCISGNYFNYILNTTWANSFNWQKGGNFKLIIFLLTEVAGEGGPDLVPQKFLFSQKFRHLMG